MAYKDQETARAAARRFREANPGYGRAQYAKHADKRRAAKVAEYHVDEAAARKRQRERYARNAVRVGEQQRAAREAHPERDLLNQAKRLLRSQAGIAMRDIPDEIAEAKAVEMAIKRAAKALLNSDNSPSR